MKKFDLMQSSFPFFFTTDGEEDGYYKTLYMSCIVATYLVEKVDEGDYKIRTEERFKDLDLTDFELFGPVVPGKKILLNLEMWTANKTNARSNEWINEWWLYGTKDETLSTTTEVELLVATLELFVQGKLEDDFHLYNLRHKILEGVPTVFLPSGQRKFHFQKHEIALALANFKNHISIFDHTSKIDKRSYIINPIKGA